MPRNAQQNCRVREERERRILSAALKLFAVNGLAATKISDIASAAGMSQGLLYHYFRSKEEVYTELIRTAFAKMNAACRGLEKHPATPAEKIRMAIHALLQGLETHGDTALYYLLITQASVSEAIPAEAKAIIRRESLFPHEALTRIFAEGQKDGSIKQYNPSQLALVFWTSIKGLAIQKAAFADIYKAPDPEILIRMFCQ